MNSQYSYEEYLKLRGINRILPVYQGNMNYNYGRSINHKLDVTNQVIAHRELLIEMRQMKNPKLKGL